MPGRKSLIVWICLALFALFGSQAFAQTDKMSPDDFATFVADHQTELSKLVDGFGTEWVRNLTWAILIFFGKFLIISLIVSFILDVLIAKGFSMIIAPTLQSFQRALVWAGSRFIVYFIYAFCIVAIFSAFAATKSGLLFFLLTIALILVTFGLLTVATSMIYQLSLGVAMAVTLSVTLLEMAMNYFVMIPLQRTYLTEGLQNVIRENFVVKVQFETERLAPQLKQAQADLDDANNAKSSLESSIDTDHKRAADFKILIEQRKKSDEFALARIAELRADGKLEEAQKEYKQFPNEFPKSPLLDVVATDLQEVTDELAQQAQQLAKQKAEDDAMKAEKEKELLAKMAHGMATLSDMRNRLLGMTRDQVKAYLGTPDGVESEEWGYSKKIIFDRAHNIHCGLAVVFMDNQVQTVDYYDYVPPTSE